MSLDDQRRDEERRDGDGRGREPDERPEDVIPLEEPEPAAHTPVPPPPPSPQPADTDNGQKPAEPQKPGVTGGGDEAPLVRPGLGGPRVALAVGAVLLVGAMVAAAVRISGLEGAGFSDATLAVFYVLYMTLLHSLTGFAALLIAARIAGRELGKAELGASRMLVAVAAFALVANLEIPIPTRLDELALAAIAYTLVVWGANRLSRLELGVVVVAHGLILIVVALGSLLDQWYTDATSELGSPVASETAPADAAPGEPPAGDPAP